MSSTAVALLNLGGPDSPEAVRPFLVNLFSDAAILKKPSLPRWFLSRLIASRRAPLARASYAKIGGYSPLLKHTQEQARALEFKLASESARVFVAMRYWHPMAAETALRVARHGVWFFGRRFSALYPDCVAGQRRSSQENQEWNMSY